MPRLAGQPLGHRLMQDDPGSGGSAGALASLYDFSDYGHDEFVIDTDAGGLFPEVLVSQWAAQSLPDPIVVPPFDVLLACGLRSGPAVLGDPSFRIRVREGGTLNVADGKILLSAVVTGPYSGKLCLSAFDQVFDEGPCTLLKVTVEGIGNGPGGPGICAAVLDAIHLCIEKGPP